MRCAMCGVIVTQDEADRAQSIVTTDETICVQCAQSLDDETDADILGSPEPASPARADSSGLDDSELIYRRDGMSDDVDPDEIDDLDN